MMIPQRGGLPHSDIHGSKPARGSPWLFAACHVLHRLLVPRHPPNALIALHTRQPAPGQNPLAGQPTHHAQEPSPEPGTTQGTPPRTQRNGKPRPAQTRSGARRTASPHHSYSAQLLTPLNPIATPGGTTLGANPSRSPRHDPFRSDNHPASQRIASPHPTQRQSASRSAPRCPARPGAHQNQIHSNKRSKTTSGPSQDPRSHHGMTGHPALSGANQPGRCRNHPMKRSRQRTERRRRRANPGGDYRIRTDDPLLAKQVLYQLS